MIGRVNVGGSGGRYSIKGWCATIGKSYSSLDTIPETVMRELMTKYASVAYFLEWYNAHNDMIDAFIEDEKAMKWIGHRDYICDKLLAITDFKTKALASEYWPYILKDKVPIMTSATAPYGSVIASSALSGNAKEKAFDGDDSTDWSVYDTTGSAFIGYIFTNPICVKKLRTKIASQRERTYQYRVEASNDTTDGADGTWIDISGVKTGTFLTDASGSYFDVDMASNDGYYKGYRLYYISSSSTTYYTTYSLQFYGRSLNVSESTQPQNKPYMLLNGTYYTVDYSERTDRTYLYDHDVTLEALDNDNYSIASSYTRDSGFELKSDSLYALAPTSDLHSKDIGTQNMIDFTNFKYLICGNRYVDKEIIVDVENVNSKNYVTLNIVRDSKSVPTTSIYVSSAKTNTYDNKVAYAQKKNTPYCEVNEIWLE